MNDRHPSGAAHAPASAPDAASAAHGSYDHGGQQGNFPGYDGYGTGTYATTGFDADPLFGDMPGSGGAYESGSWSTVQQTPPHGVTDTGQYDSYGADPYGAPQAAYDTGAYQTGSYDTTGTWATQQPAEAAGHPGTDATGQWQTQNFDPQTFDGAGYEQQTGQFGTQGFDPTGYPATGYEQQAPGPDGWQQPEYGTGQFDTTGLAAQGYETPGYGTDGQGLPVQGLDNGGFDNGGFPVGGFDTGSFETGGFETGTFDANALNANPLDTNAFAPNGYDTNGFGTGSYDTGGFDASGLEGGGLEAASYANGEQASHGYAAQDYAHVAHTALDAPEAFGAPAYGAPAAPSVPAQGGTPAVPAQGFAAHPEASGAYDATDPLNPTGSYETTGFDTATFEAIYEAPAYPEEPRYGTDGFPLTDDELPPTHGAPGNTHTAHATHAMDADAGYTAVPGAPLPPVSPPEHGRAELPADAPEFGEALELPEVATEHPGERSSAAASRVRARRRTGPKKRSALLSVAVPSACVMGVAGIAAASVGDFGDGDKETTASAPDPTSVRPSEANSRLDTQLQGVTADAGDFADRASRTQERIDLKAKKEAERKAAAEEAARKERLRPKFSLPVARHGLSAYYGQAGVNWMSIHTGIDFPVSYGTPVLAATDGTVRTQYNTAYGNMAIVTAKDGTETWYCHLSSHKVFSGEVKAGDTIAFSGNSGNSTGPHLHFEVRPGGGSAVNPLPWLQSHGLDPQ
ncbi:M23 family metallopeptidase [Streptomyces sp. NA04227]|uniref:M23 family metallopeptidase n=1 Tax=Streptomyces sp. NA04227 TaxID=2742136 RepID=UPI0034CE6A9D